MQQQFKALTGVLGALLLGISCAAAAQNTQMSDMTSATVTEKLQTAGYTKVHDVEREGSHFDADAMKDGRPVHLHVDAKTGAIAPVANEHEEEKHEAHEHPKH